jgi:hypothetical protein
MHKRLVFAMSLLWPRARTNVSYFFMKEINEINALRRILNKKGEILKISPSLPRLDTFRTRSWSN